MPVCPVCGFDNRAGVLLCENCGSDLYDSLIEQVGTKQLSRTETRELEREAGVASPSSNPIILYVRGFDEPIAIGRHGTLVIGRIEDASNEETDIDLSGYGAADLGVSRHHVTLNAEGNPPIAYDMGSSNGTFVNGQRLNPKQPYPLQSGDELRLGRLIMQIYYK